MRRAPRLSQRFTLLDRDRDLAAENFYTISTDAHIDNIVMPDVMSDGILALQVSRGANKNAAGTVHFETLPIRTRSSLAAHAMGNHPGSAASRRRPGRRIRLRYKKSCAREVAFGIDGLAANEVKELSAVRARDSLAPSRSRRSLCTVRSERSGTIVKGTPVRQFGWVRTRRSRPGSSPSVAPRPLRCESRRTRIFLRHLSKDGFSGFLRKAHRHASGVEIQHDLAAPV